MRRAGTKLPRKHRLARSASRYIWVVSMDQSASKAITKAVDAGLQKFHRSGVPQYMRWGHLFILERRAVLLRAGKRASGHQKLYP